MRKVLLVFVLVLGFMVISSGEAKAAGNGTLRHAYKPYMVEKTKWTRARVDNFAAEKKERLVCVEAFRTDNGRKTHLGCLNVPLAAHNSAEAWAFEFDAPTSWLKPGMYRVVYTYRDDWGDWHRVKSVNMTVQDGLYVR